MLCTRESICPPSDDDDGRPCTDCCSIESVPANAGIATQSWKWRDRVESGDATIGEYKAWHAQPSVDEGEVEIFTGSYGQKYGVDLLVIQCSPAELMTRGEARRAIGILW